MSEEVSEWVRKAEADHETARILARQRRKLLVDNICAGIDPAFRLLAEETMTLDKFGTDIRYPGVSATAEDARQALDAVKQVRSFVRARLGLKSQ